MTPLKSNKMNTIDEVKIEEATEVQTKATYMRQADSNNNFLRDIELVDGLSVA